MADDFGPLLATLRRVFPASRLEPVAEPELAAIRQRHPGVPEHYLALLRHVGYGSLGGTFMIYSGPVEPGEIFDPRTAAGLDGLLFFGDNFAGWVVGFDTHRGWRLVGVDNGTPDSEPQDAQTVGEFIARRLAEQQEAEPS
jgi:hypothetical protein